MRRMKKSVCTRAISGESGREIVNLLGVKSASPTEVLLKQQQKPLSPNRIFGRLPLSPSCNPEPPPTAAFTNATIIKTRKAEEEEAVITLFRHRICTLITSAILIYLRGLTNRDDCELLPPAIDNTNEDINSDNPEDSAAEIL
ncbi:hypothetical protein PIB30_013103 [Stylosanthes scabra]|uniref:Uncharacterized protein n=1 Tax=Stylosanthes scabra TaxID=79078 RepID=A0ABU6V8N1_9FABA|nr:hypothetical protein [Stylosanthes scabra]